MYRQELTHIRKCHVCGAYCRFVGIIWWGHVTIYININDGLDSFVDLIMMQTYINAAY